jgi:predicted TIM-barrel fold metal-dependent hydrolase
MKVFSIGSQSLMDVEARLRDLDNAGVDVQVIYPTLFLVPLSEDDAFETALMRSYNSWIAERCGERPDRLRWSALLPLREPAEAVREIERVAKLGAVSLVTYGTVGEKMLHAPQFDPVWAAASDSGLPVCVHVGWSFPPLRQMCDEHVSSLNISFTLPVLFGLVSFLAGGILDRFPKLRVAFLEAGAGWMPWFMERVDHYHPVANFFRKSFGLDVLPRQRPETYKDRVFATCEADEMLLPQVVEYLGENNLMVSEDMPHLEAREGSVRELARRKDIDDKVKQKILSENPARFYNLR